MCNGINMLSITTILRRMVNELYYLLFFTLFIIQEFYIRYNRVKILKKYYQFEYTIDNVSKNMKIYHNEEQYNNENKIIFLSGGFQFEYSIYIENRLMELQKCEPSFFNKYHIIVVEKLDHSIIDMYEDIDLFVRSLYDDNIPFQELTIVDFSSGGVVGNHILYNLKDIDITKKLLIV
jgi:hypothetical protein|uniref:Alpha/beta hydrolase fold-3 domain-containing protein n=1 Tax=viral metagenome TaxID=1070528 RepID=A0A6C0INA7_9ZZZZ